MLGCGSGGRIRDEEASVLGANGANNGQDKHDGLVMSTISSSPLASNSCPIGGGGGEDLSNGGAQGGAERVEEDEDSHGIGTLGANFIFPSFFEVSLASFQRWVSGKRGACQRLTRRYCKPPMLTQLTS